MADSSPMFNIPPSRGRQPNLKLLLCIPLPLLLGHAENTQSMTPALQSLSVDASTLDAPQPLPYFPKQQHSQNNRRRKPVPLDFTQIDGAHSHVANQGTNQTNQGTNQTNQGTNVAKNPDQGVNFASGALYTQLDCLRTKPVLAAHYNGVETPAKSPLRTAESLNDLTPDDWNSLANSSQIKELEKLGEGNGGSVSKCVLEQGSPVFALKLINTDPNPDTQKQIIRELQYNRLCHLANIVKYYGTFVVEKQLMIGIAMEYMGGGTLDAIYKRVLELDPTNRVNEKVLGKVAESVLKGLSYLHLQKIIHRDIKPSNILFDTRGNVKICDFGVSGDVVNSLATTFVGTQYYMAPERIMGQPYTVSCDVWSLGVTLLEVAQGKFPFHSQSENPLGPIELLSLILEIEPKLEDAPDDQIYWSNSFRNFLGYCLKKCSEDRPGPQEILAHPWCVGQLQLNVNMEKFVKRVWGL